MSEHSLILEVVSGPLDGQIIQLTADTDFSREGEGLLVFPWDSELGTPQARFTPTEQGWLLEAFPSAHRTRCIIDGAPTVVSEPIMALTGYMVSASNTWLLIRQAS